MSWRASTVAFFAYSLLTAALTFPLVLHLSSVVPHDLGDPLVSTSILWWNAHVVPLTTRWWDGFAFFPSTGTLAFSDHRLGESLIASPLQWLGLGPVAAYNLTLLLTFPLCALSAHWLGFTLTRRHDAAAIAGLVYGFNPYRIAHIEHLELLAAFAMPSTLVALHGFVSTRRTRWLVLFVAALIVTGLCTSYYLLFFAVLLVLWMLWFLRIGDWPTGVAILAGGLCSVCALLPIAVGFWRIHQRYGFARPLNVIVTLSADLTSFVTASPLIALWGWTGSLNGAERQLFPGLTAVALVAVAAAVAVRRMPREERRTLDTVAISFMPIAFAFVAVAVVAAVSGPRRLALGPIVLTIGAPFKPLSIAILAAGAAVLMSAPVRSAFRRRSTFGFYVLATIALFIFCLGPKAKFLGRQFWYEPPYAWLMQLPLFSSGVRVPARFAMPAILTLSAAAAIAFSRLHFGARGRRIAIVGIAAAIIAEGWMRALPLPTVPDTWNRPDVSRFAAVVELPITDDLFADTAAMLRATHHGRPLINGNSGYDPPEYWALRVASEEHDWSALRAYTSAGSLLVAIPRARDEGGRIVREVRALNDARLLDANDRWTFMELPAGTAPQRCDAAVARIVSAHDSTGPVDVGILTDRDPKTRWFTRNNAQSEGDMLELDLERPTRPCDIRLSVGPIAPVYPRALSVQTSIDRQHWDVVFQGSTAAATIRGAIAVPNDVWIDIVPTRDMPARYVRLRLERSQKDWPWVVADIVVKGARNDVASGFSRTDRSRP
ncbi:MAG TPA: discoidin domain-containing protein [Vicinamibacterales bacterium]